jgi:hypothetical protein
LSCAASITALIALSSSSSWALELSFQVESTETVSCAAFGGGGGGRTAVMVSAGGPPATRRTTTVELREMCALSSVYSSPVRATLSLGPRPRVRPWPWRLVPKMRRFRSATEMVGAMTGTENVSTPLRYL